jgi:hypothetical protein
MASVVQHDVHHRVLIRLLPVLSAVAVVACSSSPTGSVDIGGSSSSVTTSSVESSIGSTETDTATAPATSTVRPDAATIALTTSPSPPAPITTVAPPLPVEGTGVRGRVTAGPTCPVERPDQPCPPNPVHGRVDVLDAAGRTVADATRRDRFDRGRARGLPWCSDSSQVRVHRKAQNDPQADG